MKRSSVMLAILFCFAGMAGAQQPNPKMAPTKPSVTTEQSPQTKFKAIWEPVNYKQDLTLTDVFFVSDEEGWVTGQRGTILHTKDGGNSWTPQLGGDPHSGEDTVAAPRFLDAKHGWAAGSQAFAYHRRRKLGTDRRGAGDVGCRGVCFSVTDRWCATRWE